METTKCALKMHKGKLLLTTHAQFYLKAINFHKAARSSATSRCCVIIFPADGLMPDSNSLSANRRKQSQQITCRTYAQSSSPVVFSTENNSHIKSYGHLTQVDVLLDCVILTVTYVRGHRQLSLWPPPSQILNRQALCKFNMRTNKWKFPSSHLVKVRFWAKNLYQLASNPCSLDGWIPLSRINCPWALKSFQKKSHSYILNQAIDK